LNECLKWFGYWLKGEPTGVMREPPVTLFIREYSPPATILMADRGAFRCENEWPIARCVETPFYFSANRQLTRRSTRRETTDRLVSDPLTGSTTGMHGGGPFNTNWVMPLDQRPDELHALTYTTVPLPNPVEVIGRPRAVLHFSSTANITQFFVKLCDVAPDGTSALVTKGYLTVNHRKPGQPYRVDVELLVCAYRFRKGHRIRVSVASGDLLNVWPTPKSCVNTIHCGAGRPSQIVLPIIPPRKRRGPNPALKLSAKPPIRRKDLTAPEFSITHDPIHETATVRYALAYGSSWPHRVTCTVSNREPAVVILDAESQFTATCEGKEIVTHAHCVTRSDRSNFRHTVDLKITVAGKLYRKKHWDTKVPRGLV
jgi:hypothetical protein